MDEITAHYNKFNEDKRLSRRHGQVEYLTTLRYVHEVLDLVEASRDGEGKPAVIDIGAGTGAYAIPLALEGHAVTAVEYVKYNLGRLKQNAKRAEADARRELFLGAYQGDARRLKRFADGSFDVALLFGPMYHLFSEEDKVAALSEAARVVRPGGYVLVAYLMNEYGVIRYGIREGHLLECLQDGRLDESFHCRSQAKDLYDYVRLEDVQAYASAAGLTRVKSISADGPADYLRRELAAMSEAEFEKFMEYHLSTCERPELLGAGAHLLDILQK